MAGNAGRVVLREVTDGLRLFVFERVRDLEELDLEGAVVNGGRGLAHEFKAYGSAALVAPRKGIAGEERNLVAHTMIAVNSGINAGESDLLANAEKMLLRPGESQNVGVLTRS